MASIRRVRSSRCCRAAAATSCAPSCRISCAPPALIAARVPGVQFVSRARRIFDDELFAPLSHWPQPRQRRLSSRADSDAVLGSADVALIASGTVTVQAALHGCPMVVVYRVAPLTYTTRQAVAARGHVRDGESRGRARVVPELIQDEFTPEAAAREALRVLTDPLHAAKMRADLADVTARLGGAGASRRAAEEVLAVARDPGPTQR